MFTLKEKDLQKIVRVITVRVSYFCIFFSAQMAQLLLQGFVTGNTFQFFDGLEQFVRILPAYTKENIVNPNNPVGIQE